MKRYIVIALIACVCFFNGCGSDNTFLDVTKSSATSVPDDTGTNDTGDTDTNDTGDFYISWQKCLGGSAHDNATSIQQTSDGGYIVAGNTFSNDGDVTGYHGGDDYWVVKLDSNGNMKWQKCLGGSYGDCAKYIQQTSDGGYIVAGYTFSNDGDVTGLHGDSDYWVVKLDSNGNIKWQKCLGGSGNEGASSIQQARDGGYIIAGASNYSDGDVTGNHGGYDSWIVKLDANGNF